MKICNKCNATIPDDSLFCLNCGATIETAETAETAVEAPKKKGNKGAMIAIIIVAVILVLAVAGGALWYFVLRDDSSAVNGDSDESVSAEEDEDEDKGDDEKDEGATDVNGDGDSTVDEELTTENKADETTTSVEETTAKTEDREETTSPVVNPPSSGDSDAVEQKIADYVARNKDEIINGFYEGFSSSETGLTCTVDIEASGTGIILTVCFNELDNLTDDVKEQMQSAYDSMAYVFESSFSMMQTEIPEVEYLQLDICEKDGDIIATIVADGVTENYI